VHAKFEVRSFTRSGDNRGHPKKLGSPWIRHAAFSPNFFSWAFVRMDLVIVLDKFEVRSFTRSS